MDNYIEKSSVWFPRHRQAKEWMSSMATIVVITMTAGFMLLGHTSALNAQNIKQHVEKPSDPSDYYFVFYYDPPEKKAYAKKLIKFVERLQHDKTTFDTDLSAKLDKLSISLLTSPDGKVKLYSWNDGDIGSAICFNTIYQTNNNGEFQAVFMKNYYREPRNIYQVESSTGPVYLVKYFFRAGGWSYYVGVDAFTIDETGLLQPANVFECIPELHDATERYSASLSVECSPSSPSLYYDGGWEKNFFVQQSGKDLYMPHYAKLRGGSSAPVMTDFYHRFKWDGEKYHYKQIEYNPVLAKQLPEAGWLLEEFELDDMLIRIDSVAGGSYRLIVWDAAHMFSSAPEFLVPEGRYDAARREFHFQNIDNKNLFEGLPSICVKLDDLDADDNSYDGSKGDFDTDANVILVKKDGVWRVFTFK